MATDDDTGCPDPMRAFDQRRDPLDEHAVGPTTTVARLLAARDLLRAGEPEASAASARDARSGGIPAELVPGARAIEAGALLLAGGTAEAIELLRTAWAEHPDVAVLPALLGVAQARAGDEASAVRSMHAALASDDPDRSLELHRWLITRLLAQLRAGG